MNEDQFSRKDGVVAHRLAVRTTIVTGAAGKDMIKRHPASVHSAKH
jgi:hypothetical protein